MKPIVYKLILISSVILVISLSMAALAYAQPTFIIEPHRLFTNAGGPISIYASADFFTISTTIRLVNYGLLNTIYVNPRAVQAIVPAGLSGGDYEVRALDINGVETTLGAIRLKEIEPTEEPEESDTPTPGQPNLTIRNYWIEPPQVRPGQEFTVSVEVYNNGSRAGENTMAVFPGGTFLPVGENGHMFWQVHINAAFVAAQRMRVPSDASNGIHQLPVNLSANDWEGRHFDFSQSVSVEVIGASSGSSVIVGKPKVLVEGARTSPPVISPGSAFSLTLRLANRGNRTALNVMLSADAAVVLPASGGGTASLDSLRMDEVSTVTLPLLLKPGKEGGQQGLALNLEYGDYSGGNHSDHQTVSLNVDTSLANRPQLLIDSYRTTPDKISPGDIFTLTLQLVNVGGGDAQRLTLALGGENGENLGAFAPTQGSNVSFVSALAAGRSISLELALMAAGNAETKAHSLPVALAYDTGGGTREKDTQRISLVLYRRPQFKASFYRPMEGVAMVEQPIQLPIEVVNASAARFTIPEISLSSPQLEFMGETSAFVGPLDSGSAWSLDTTAVTSQAGSITITVNIAYVDDLNQTQVISVPLSLDVQDLPPDMGPGEPGGPEGPEQPETLWQKVERFFRGFLGLGS